MEHILPDNIFSFSDGRVFIDIAHGCGNGCSYCYCRSANEKQVVYSEKELDMAVKTIFANSQFIRGKTGTLVSFCPHTETFKSCESTKALLSVIEHFLQFDNRIQISTKEVIPDSFIETVMGFNIKMGQITIFTSISSLNNHKDYEPNTPDVITRLENIVRLRDTNIKSCLYIKPFLMLENDMEETIKIINDLAPDTVCIGVYYKQGEVGKYRHPTDDTISSKGINNGMSMFIKKYNSKTPLFLTSSCVVAYLNQIINNVTIPQQLCVNCKCFCKRNKNG